MSTAREQLAAALRAALPARWNVIELGREPDSITRPTVVLYRSTFKPSAEAPKAQLDTTFSVWVLIAPDGRDNDLDDRADTVTGAIDDIPWAAWTEATRGAHRGVYPGYEITVTANFEKVQEA